MARWHVLMVSLFMARLIPVFSSPVHAAPDWSASSISPSLLLCSGRLSHGRLHWESDRRKGRHEVLYLKAMQFTCFGSCAGRKDGAYRNASVLSSSL